MTFTNRLACAGALAAAVATPALRRLQDDQPSPLDFKST
jgi:hypothetical protein